MYSDHERVPYHKLSLQQLDLARRKKAKEIAQRRAKAAKRVEGT